MISLLINSINFPRLGLFCPLCWWTNDLSLSLTSEPFVVFSSPWPTEEGSDGVVWWAPAIQTGSPHPAILTIPVQPPCIYKNLHQTSTELSAVPIQHKFVWFSRKVFALWVSFSMKTGQAALWGWMKWIRDFYASQHNRTPYRRDRYSLSWRWNVMRAVLLN